MAEMLAYLDKNSPIHRLAGATKLLCFILWSLAAMLTYDTRILVFMLVIGLTLFKLSKIRWKEVSFVVLLFGLFLLLNNIAIFLFSPKQGVEIYGTEHLLFSLAGPYEVTTEQLFYLFNVTLKYFTVIPIALLFILTTNPSEFASSFHRIGISYRITYAISITLRYIPDIQRDYRNIALSKQARGNDLSRKASLITRGKNAMGIIIPLIFVSLNRIEAISNVMDLRGFGKKKTRTWYREKPFDIGDYLAISLIAILFISSIVITFYDGQRFYNPFE
ncbi:energy-coupling factor transporter transmembrane component T family protein [Niallia sp. Sow4_A1]|jgi:energy-coupling factor transport system permease protein|uniref:energy-coupling factor transporter transmembrane component T family protein n=1 Tax=Bacillaceae TaxID=186817 RepID=UPI0004E1D2BC|nr:MULTISPECIES: energy-coupling factor transporter transmembrane component T [Bacillaceae]MCF2649347.1 energy-coupling factor transporter transmembrane protein EcfT [Niallia circulans]CAI9393160.1 Energy-coupling factor transporter transmembrane protein EcfT [Bacillus sp. T2.9-1]